MLSMVLGFLGIGTPELLVILFAVLLLFGGKKLPELARGLGKGLREFKDASETIKRDISEQINEFEKDLDVDVSKKDQENLRSDQHAAAPADTREVGSTQEADAQDPRPTNAAMTPPPGTHQHVPRREPDYYGSQDVYYNESQNPGIPSDPENGPEKEA